jgi:hypothetical protein
MEELQTDDNHPPTGLDIEMINYLNLDGDGEEQSHRKDDAKWERQPSLDADGNHCPMDVYHRKEEDAKGERQPSPDANGEHSPTDVSDKKEDAKGVQRPSADADEELSDIDVDLKGLSSAKDEGKTSSDLRVPVDFDITSLEKFCKEASRSFFNETGLVSHQINSYNDFISHGLQELIDSLGEISVEPDYDPSNKAGAWKHATVKFGRVELGMPEFLADNGDLDDENLKLKPKHARLQKMTYASSMKVEITVEVSMLLQSYLPCSYCWNGLRGLHPLPYHLGFMVGLVSGIHPSWYPSQVVSSSSPGNAFLFRCA